MSDNTKVTSMASKVSVCVTEYKDGDIKGSIYNAYYQKRIPFNSTTELINGMESLYNTLSFPQKFMETRSFGVNRRIDEDKCEDNIKPVFAVDEDNVGIANFDIHVKFRMNADWQGEICWIEKGNRSKFNSTLDMIKLMDAALNK